jgi:hypothetical protein
MLVHHDDRERIPICGWLKKEEKVFIPPTKKMTIGATYTGFFWPQTGFFQPKLAFLGQKSAPFTGR